MKYLLLSRKRKSDDGIGVWWAPNSMGYTNNVQNAGRFEEEVARRKEAESRGTTIAISEDEVAALTTRTIVDFGDFDNFIFLQTKLSERRAAAMPVA